MNLLGVAKVQLPTIAYPTVSISGAGMMGNMNVPLIGMVDAMSATINFLTVTSGEAVFYALPSARRTSAI